MTIELREPEALLLKPEQVRRVISPDDVKGTKDLEPLEGLLGQERLKMGIQTVALSSDTTLHLYVSDMEGKHRDDELEALIREELTEKFPVNDLVYAHNFNDPYSPHAFDLKPGEGNKLRELVNTALHGIYDAYKKKEFGEEYRKKLSKLVAKKSAITKDLEIKLDEADEFLQDLLPEDDDEDKKETSGKKKRKQTKKQDDDYKFKKKEVRTAYEKVEEIRGQLEKSFYDANTEIRTLQHKLITDLVNERFSDALATFSDESVVTYLQSLASNFIDYFQGVLNRDFDTTWDTSDILDDPTSEPVDLRSAIGERKAHPELARLRKNIFPAEYTINVAVDNSDFKDSEQIPIVFQRLVAHDRMFGYTRRRLNPGGHEEIVSLAADIEVGAVHRARGGYLVLDLADLEKEKPVYNKLIETLRSETLNVSPLDPDENPLQRLTPNDIPSNVTVVIRGNHGDYHIKHDEDLVGEDPLFTSLFRTEARSVSYIRIGDDPKATFGDYARLLKQIVDHNDLKDFSPSGVAAMLEHSMREQESQRELSVQMRWLEDLVYEANQLASDSIDREHIEQVVADRETRLNQDQEREWEMIQQGINIHHFEGEQVGQMNALAYIESGNFRYGTVFRITAGASVEESDPDDTVVHISKKSKESGSSFDHGIEASAAYLRHAFGSDKRFSVHITLNNEQQYGFFDGPSSSAANTCIALSYLSETPLKQGITMTGAISQIGEVQAIGGVNEKIENYYDAVQRLGIEGELGVIIPQANISELMLRRDITDAVKDGKFSIYAVGRIEEAMAVLTGKNVGDIGKPSEAKSLYGIVNDRLTKMNDAAVKTK